MIDLSRAISFDIETDGVKYEYALQPWRVAQKKAWITTAAWYYLDDRTPVTEALVYPTPSQLRAMLRQAAAEKRPVLGWNVTFDAAFLISYGLRDEVFACQWVDGMRLWRHLDIEPEYDSNITNRRRYKLKGPGGAVDTFVPEMSGYDDGITYHALTKEQMYPLLDYNVKDTKAAHISAQSIWAGLNPRQRTAALIEATSIPFIADANLRGMSVDHAAIDAADELMDKQAAEAEAKLTEYGVTPNILRSPKQLEQLLFEDWGLAPLKKTSSGARSTDKETLHELAPMDPRAKWLRDWREALNLKSKFSSSLRESTEYNGDNKTHPDAILFGTYSGRLTYGSKQGKNKDTKQTGFALHQTKSGKTFRSIIVPPPGYTFGELDAAGQEFRWMAVQSGDENMLQLCLPGEDPHSFMGSKADPDETHTYEWVMENKEGAAKGIRKLGKVANLCLAEGTKVLTDRGVCSIEDVRLEDRVWDGIEFVSHDGVQLTGTDREVVSYGVTATPEHGVLVHGRWESIEDAARHGWAIEPSLGSGWQNIGRAAARILGGIGRRAVSEVWSALLQSTLQVWRREGRQSTHGGNGTIDPVQGMSCVGPSHSRGSANQQVQRRLYAAQASRRLVSENTQPEASVVSQLRRAWDRVSVRFRQGGRRIREAGAAALELYRFGAGPYGQRWALRAGEYQARYQEGQPKEQAARVYDIINCGPRHRFAANGVIVHNSLQFRTFAKKLRSVARVQYSIPMEMPEAVFLRDTYLETYEKVPIFWENQIAFGRKHGYVETLAGRRVQIKGNWVKSNRNLWSMESTTINYPIQGTGADQKYLALAVLKNFCVQHGVYFAFDLHDGLYWYLPEANAEGLLRQMKKILDNLPYRQAWGFKSPIPLPFDAKIGTSWGTLKELEGDK